MVCKEDEKRTAGVSLRGDEDDAAAAGDVCFMDEGTSGSTCEMREEMAEAELDVCMEKAEQGLPRVSPVEDEDEEAAAVVVDVDDRLLPLVVVEDRVI